MNTAMPSAAKLVAALGLALLAFVVSGLIIPLFPESTNFGYFVYVNVALGVCVGWIVIGKRAGAGMIAGINIGITGAVLLVLWGLFIQGCNEMTRLAMDNRYDGPFEAIIAVFEIGAEWGYIISTVPVWGTLIVGGALTGMAAEIASRLWR